jgi:hypothetical protein
MREMVMSLLRTNGHEMDLFPGAVKVMKQNVQRMERKSRTSKLEDAPVRSIMHQPLQGNRRMGSAIAESYVKSNTTLEIGPKGDANFSDGGRLLQSSTANSGLASALNRLHARRKPAVEEHQRKGPQKKSTASLSMLSTSETSYYQGEMSEAALYGDRYVGELGEAQSYGSLHWIQSS